MSPKQGFIFFILYSCHLIGHTEYIVGVQYMFSELCETVEQKMNKREVSPKLIRNSEKHNILPHPIVILTEQPELTRRVLKTEISKKFKAVSANTAIIKLISFSRCKHGAFSVWKSHHREAFQFNKLGCLVFPATFNDALR